MKKNYQKSYFTADFIFKWTILITHLTQFIRLSFWLLIDSKDLRASERKDGMTKKHNIWNNWRTSTAYALNFVNWQIWLCLLHCFTSNVLLFNMTQKSRVLWNHVIMQIKLDLFFSVLENTEYFCCIVSTSIEWYEKNVSMIFSCSCSFEF